MINKIIECPSCGSIATLEEYHARTFANSIKEFIDYNYLSYSCECLESWTTTESDTISISTYTRKIRSVRRKRCIKNLM